MPSPEQIVPEEFSPMDPGLTNGRWIDVVNELREGCPVFHSSAHEDDGFYVLTKSEDLLYAHLVGLGDDARAAVSNALNKGRLLPGMS